MKLVMTDVIAVGQVTMLPVSQLQNQDQDVTGQDHQVLETVSGPVRDGMHTAIRNQKVSLCN